MSDSNQDVYIFPLSAAQRRFWIVDQLEPGLPLSVPTVYRLLGPLNLDAVRHSIAEIVRRHEVLRTTVEVMDNEPVQVVVPELQLDIPLLDLSDRRVEADEERRIVSEIVWAPFDLKNGPLIRAAVIRIAEQEHIFVVSIHHILCDGWSQAVLIREFAECYDAFVAGRKPALAELPLQYADFSVWQREMLQGGHLDDAIAYWKGQFADLPPELDLAFGSGPANGQHLRGGYERFEFDLSLGSALKAFSQREGVTLFMTLLAAYQALLYRYTGEEDIVIGCPVANRSRAELQDLIGCFMNPLPLRTMVSGDITFRELLARVRDAALGAYSHQELPFDILVNTVQPNRRSRLPLFQAMFIFQNFTDGRLNLQSLEAQQVKPDIEAMFYPALLMMGERNGQLVGYVEYAMDRYGTILSQLPRHLETLLRAAIAGAETPIARLPVLPAEDRELLLTGWNRTTREFPAKQPQELFEKQARERPGALALVHDGRELTYEQLNKRANQLAHYLRSLGIGPDVLAGVALERGIDLIVALLGILKAGGGYVPLDLAYPKDRLHLMLANSNAPVIVTTKESSLALPEHHARAVYLDTEGPAIAACSDENPQPLAAPEHLAYVIYTSGSTGVPKGVMVERRSIANYTQAAANEFLLTPADRVLQFASISFDTAAEEIFPCFAAGAALVMRPESMMNSIRDFIDHLGRLGITVLDLPTAFWHEMTRAMEEDKRGHGGVRGKWGLTPPAKQDASSLLGVPLRERGQTPFSSPMSPFALPACLRLVILGGEKAMAERVAAWRRVAPGVRLLNTYGPTEITVVATTFDLTARNSALDMDDPPIGRPVANAEAFVLSPKLELVPVGFPGELFIGGIGLARGYLNQPELTAERFIVHSFDSGSGRRLYKTGDRVRYSPDGQLLFLGRMDSQVKIRGYRIELQEVEAALRRHATIKDVVVIADELQPGQTRLVAYVATGANKASSAAELRAHLKQSLPDFMLPAAFVFLERLPLLPNGKVDRKSLPKPDQQPAAAGDTYVEPGTTTEKSLADIWARILRVKRVGTNDNFFELGGDSILSIQIVAKAAQAGLRFTPRDLFQHQTIAELAAVAATGSVAQSGPESVDGEAPLLPSQRSFLEQNWTEPQNFTQAVLLDVRKPISEEVLREALAAVTAHHDAFRLRFARASSGFKQFYDSAQNPLPVTKIDLSGELPEQRQTGLEEAAARIRQNLNLELGPLWGAALLDFGADGLRLLWVVHHLIVDGVSWRILVEDLTTALVQLQAGDAVRLPEKTTSLKRWSESLQSYGRSPVLRNDLEYWIAAAATHRPVAVPVDIEGNTNTFGSTEEVFVDLGIEETRVLLQKIPQVHKTQANEVLLAALVETLRGWTGGSSFSIRLEGHGREDLFEGIDLSRTVGWFTAFFPVFFEIKEASSSIETLRCVKEQLRRVPTKGLALGLAYLTEDRDLLTTLRTNQPQVLFNYLGQFDQVMNDSSWFAVAKERTGGSNRSAHAIRNALLDINASVVNGRLQLVWTYSRNFHYRETIERVADSFVAALRALLQNDDQSRHAYTPSDFSDFGWSDDDLDEIVSDLGGIQEGV